MAYTFPSVELCTCFNSSTCSDKLYLAINYYTTLIFHMCWFFGASVQTRSAVVDRRSRGECPWHGIVPSASTLMTRVAPLAHLSLNMKSRAMGIIIFCHGAFVVTWTCPCRVLPHALTNQNYPWLHIVVTQLTTVCLI